MTILNATLSTSEYDIIGFRMIQDATPYITSIFQRYGIQAKSQEEMHAGMVVMFMYNLCIIQELLGNGRYPNANDTAFASFYPKNSVGYDLLFGSESRKIIDYIVTKNASIYASDIERLKQTYGVTAAGLVASLLRWNPEKRGGGKGNVLKDAYFTPFRSQRDCNPQQKKSINTFLFVIGSSAKGKVAYLKYEPRLKQYYLFNECSDLRSFLEGGCTPEDLKGRPSIDIESNRLVLMDIQNKRMQKQDQLYVIDLPTLVQIAMVTKSGNVATKGPVTISMQVLSAVRNFKKKGVL
jgi:hypothetical protein